VENLLKRGLPCFTSDILGQKTRQATSLQMKLQLMTSDSIFVLAVALLTLGGVFFYLLRVEALARKLEFLVRDDELDAPLQGAVPLASALETGDQLRSGREAPLP